MTRRYATLRKVSHARVLVVDRGLSLDEQHVNHGGVAKRRGDHQGGRALRTYVLYVGAKLPREKGVSE